MRFHIRKSELDNYSIVFKYDHSLSQGYDANKFLWYIKNPSNDVMTRES